LGGALASVLTAAAAIGAASASVTVCDYVEKQGDAVTVLEMSALRAVAEVSQDGGRGETGFGALAADCAARLRERLARPGKGRNRSGMARGKVESRRLTIVDSDSTGLVRRIVRCCCATWPPLASSVPRHTM
jgi:hypothetical protein